MAFKMKGSPHKRGTIQGTSGYTSALKQKTKYVDMSKIDIESKEEIIAQQEDPNIHKYNVDIGYPSGVGDKGYGPTGEFDEVGFTMSPDAFKEVWQAQNSGPGWKIDYEEYLRWKNWEAASTKSGEEYEQPGGAPHYGLSTHD